MHRSSVLILTLLLSGCRPAPPEAATPQTAPAPSPVVITPESLHRLALVVDLHNDALYFHTRGLKDISRRSDSLQVDIPRLRSGGIDAAVFAIWPNPRLLRPHQYARFVLDALDTLKQICHRESTSIAIAGSPEELHRIVAAGRVAAIPAIEGGHALQGNLALLDTFYNRGVRIITLTWNNSNELADAAADPTPSHGGLSPLGFKTLRRMNELGIIVDISHASARTVSDVTDSSRSPVIASHSGAAALCPGSRNLTDDQLRAIAATGGLIGIIFYPPYLRLDRENATISDVLDQLDYVKKRIGADYVALGSDFDGLTGPAPSGLEDATSFPAITAGLRRRGWSDSDICKALGGNFVRIWQDVCRAARTTRSGQHLP